MSDAEVQANTVTPSHRQTTAAEQLRFAIQVNLKSARSARSMSLRDLAKATGLSPALLSQLERGIANPTVEALGRIADTLQISFAELTHRPQVGPVIVRAGKGPATVEATTGSVIRDLFNNYERRRFEIRHARLEPDCATPDASHGGGSSEYAYVTSGTVTVVCDGWEAELVEGDAISFSGDSEHLYRTGEDACELITVVALGNTLDDLSSEGTDHAERPRNVLRMLTNDQG